ncbi:MAG: class I SAM-dependent methyltransferase [Clostridium sp.]|nr:class I SAM-dependent methyltransferase [Clostridium sp.]MCM1172316.1 class I SAM-dependent methyltransferase [Clostridium sp.]MCM1208980.1 class I SAM-dependent methyltransferase [Ruminococcus sp.]
MNRDYLKTIWKQEEETAHIHGWDFSHIEGRYEAEQDLPWDYEGLVRKYLKSNLRILDYDTGGGEFLLSLNHPYDKTAATEGYPPNVRLCQERLLPLGICFKECADPSRIPFEDEAFDLIINRHGGFCAKEIHRLLRPNGLIVTEQVGGDNEQDLVKLVLPRAKKPFPKLNLANQRKEFEDAGLQIVQAEEAYRSIKFYDVGAFVWFAHVIEWEFPDFSVDGCFSKLLKMQQIIEKDGFVQGTIHRYLIVAKKG